MRDVPTFDETDLARVVAELNLQTPVPVAVVIGGASNLDRPDPASPTDEDAGAPIRAVIEDLFIDALRPAVRQTGAVVLTGGTDAGVMRIAGRTIGDAATALIGVVPRLMVDGRDRTVKLETNHSAAVLTSGARWGSETETLFDLAERITGGTAPGVVVLANGGDVSLEEARRFLRGGWPILTVHGSGGASEDLLRAASNAEPDARWGDLHQADVEDLSSDRVLARRQLVWRMHNDELLKAAWTAFASYDERAETLKASARRTRWWLTGVSSLLLILITSSVQFAAVGWMTPAGELAQNLRPAWLNSALPPLLHVLKWAVLVLPVGAAVAAALGNFTGSQSKWRTVRASAETLKRQIYRYRAGVAVGESEAPKRLAAVLHVVDDEAIRANVGLAETPTGLMRGRPRNVDQDELEALNARIYVKRRLEQQVLWFKHAARDRRRGEFLVVVAGAVAAAVAMALVNTQLAPWVALLVLAASTFTFSRERGLTRQQVAGFDRAIADVNDAWIGWLQRSADDRTELASLATLVSSVEDAFERESLSWSEVMRRAAQGQGSPNLGLAP